MAKKKNVSVNGKNYYRVFTTVGFTDEGKRIRKQFYGTSKREAEEKRDEYLAGIKRGLGIDYNKATFNAVFDEWLFEVKKPSVADSSFNRYESIYRIYIKTADFANKPLITIKSLDIQKLYNTLTPSKADRVHVLLNNFFLYCVKEDIIIKNPCLNTKKPKDEQIKKDDKLFFTDDEVAVLNKAFKKDPSLFIFQFALATGMRQGEILALTHADIKGDVIHIEKSVNIIKVIDRDSEKSKRQAIIRPCKNAASIRDIPLSSTLKNNLLLHIKSEKEKHLKKGVKFSEDNLLFTNTKCGLMQANHLLARWKRVEASLRLTACKFHILRHTFCSLLAKNGVPLKTASVLMGHSNIEITAKIYTHVEDKQKASAIEKLNNVLSQF